MPNAFDYLKLPDPGNIGRQFQQGLDKGRVQSALSAFSRTRPPMRRLPR